MANEIHFDAQAMDRYGVLGLVRLPQTGACHARCERGDRSGRVGVLPGLLDADQVGGQDCRAAVAFLEFGIDEPDAFKIGSGDDAEADVVEFGRQAGLQVNLGAFVDDRRDHIGAGENGCPLLGLERHSSTGVNVVVDMDRLLHAHESLVVATSGVTYQGEVVLHRCRVSVVANGAVLGSLDPVGETT